MINFIWIAFLFISTFFCQQEFKCYKINGYGQGTTYSITYYTKGNAIRADQVDSVLNEIDVSMSLYKKGSVINQFNSSKRGVKIDEHFKKVLVKSLEIYKSSDGAFDVTVQPLVQAWNFGTEKTDFFPDPGLIKKIKQHVGSEKLVLSGDSLLKKDPDVKIDLNGIAQGYSVDVLASLLEKNGIENYLVELGGEIRVKGVKQPTKDPFKIGIQSPGKDAMDTGSMEIVLELPNGAITTSGNYRKFYMNGNKKISHLINPVTGYPFQNELISATIFAKDALTADGYDNVFMGMGLKHAFKFLKSHPEMEIYLIYQKKDGSLADTASAGFMRLSKISKND